MLKKSLICKFETLILFAFGTGLLIGSRWRDVLRSNHHQVVSSSSRKFYVHEFEKRSYFTCKPKRDIFFLKTHKTAGTVVQNVILRHADRENLFVGLSASPGDARFRYAEGASFRGRFLKKSTHDINILCHHMRYQDDEVKRVMSEDATFITIIRDTGPMFESYFDYFHWNSRPFAKVPNNLKGMDEWLDNSNEFFKGRQDGSFWWFAKNGLSYDLGFNNLMDDDKYIASAIAKVEKTYHLVMIADYFEMSLILLKDLLCLKLEDITYLDLNLRLEKNYNITPELDKKIRQWNKADAAIFDHFNKTFWEKVKAFGEKRMKLEVEKLRRMNKKLMDDCIEGEGAVVNKKVHDSRYKVFNPKGVKMGAYNIKPEAELNKKCQDVVKPEMSWFKYLLFKQYSNHNY